MSTEQRTLSGDEADCGRVRPQTLVKCHTCGEYILRSDQYAHPTDHRLVVPSWTTWNISKPLGVVGR